MSSKEGSYISLMQTEEGHPGKHPNGFPFRPYDVQHNMMDALTRAIDLRAIGIFESPTGTGKTLSVICATMSWLIAHRADPDAYEKLGSGSETRDAQSANQAAAAEDDEPDWVNEFVHTKARDCLAAVNTRRARSFANRVRNAKQGNSSRSLGKVGKKIPRLGCSSSASRDASLVDSAQTLSRGIQLDKDALRFLIDDSSDAETASNDSLDNSITHEGSPFEHHQNRRVVQRTPGTAPDIEPRLRVVFATRTHSQLTQFISEIRKTNFGADTLSAPIGNLNQSFPDTTGDGPWSMAYPPLSIVAFGSRNVMCINDEVRSLSSPAAVADRCRDLLSANPKGKSANAPKRSRSLKAGTSGCPYKNDDAESILRDTAIVHMHDVEELAVAGKAIGGCPYFAARAAVASGAVDVIGVPYSAILHEPTRAAIGLTIDDRTIVIFDEAHNIASTVNEIHAAVVTSVDLSTVRSAILVYVDKYKSRLASRSLFSIRQLVAVIDGLLSVLAKAPQPTIGQLPDARVVTSPELIFDAGIENLNLFALSLFLSNSRLCQKLGGFIDAERASETDRPFSNESEARLDSNDLSESQSKTKLSISAVERFLQSLNSSKDHSRVVIYSSTATNLSSRRLPKSTGYLRYFMLRPGGLFSSAVRSARAVLLVGGTLSPRQVMKDTLLRELSSRPVVEFECDHVIPASNLMAIALSESSSRKILEFTHRTKNDSQLMDELGRSLIRVTEVSRGGIVLFFASYSYMNAVLERWKVAGIETILMQLKPVFSEARGSSSAWMDYSSAIAENAQRGAILAAVMGGRLSEGINFSDDLGRVVIVVGMPFPNANDVETAEVLRTLDTSSERSAYLENSCMTIVNQAIGRAIRSSSDYATIVLCDRRFNRPHILDKLPKFIRQSLAVAKDFAHLRGILQTFFSRQR
jgi:chromosome transmission fidelity protein 1